MEQTTIYRFHLKPTALQYSLGIPQKYLGKIRKEMRASHWIGNMRPVQQVKEIGNLFYI